MGSEVRKYQEKILEKKESLFNARVINFPNDKKFVKSENLKLRTIDFWKINEKSNEDQLKTIIGICFTLGALTLLGLYSNLF